MPRKRILNVLFKEWELLFTDINTALLVTLLPLLIVAQGIFYMWLAVHFGGQAIAANAAFQTALARVGDTFPAVRSLPGEQQLQVLLLQQFNFYLLMIPTVIAMTVAAFSIVDEKLSGSLEALLATPVRTWELLLGKTLAGAIPALVVTCIAGGVFLLVVAAMGWGGLIGYVANPSWYLSLFLLTPAVAVLSFILGVMGSSRAKDAKSAQNAAILIVLPVLVIIGIQVTGVVWFSPLLTLLLALAVCAVDVLVLRVAVRLSQREAILTRWR